MNRMMNGALGWCRAARTKVVSVAYRVGQSSWLNLVVFISTRGKLVGDGSWNMAAAAGWISLPYGEPWKGQGLSGDCVAFWNRKGGFEIEYIHDGRWAVPE